MLLLNRLGVGIVHSDVRGLAQEHLGANRALKHCARRLSGPETWDPIAAGKTLVGFAYRLAEHIWIYFYLELHLTFRQMLNFNPHGR
jgi:hypothetical protein